MTEMNMPKIARLHALSLLLAMLCGPGIGCGVRSYSVEGTVSFDDGKPAGSLAGGIVTFESTDAKTSAQGVIQEDGSYRLSTVKYGSGAPAGEYRISVRPLPLQKSLIDGKYWVFATSGLNATVKEESNRIPIQVSKPSAPEPARKRADD
jgi:hypothetical protein